MQAEALAGLQQELTLAQQAAATAREDEKAAAAAAAHAEQRLEAEVEKRTK